MQIVYTITSSFIGCFITHYEVAAFKTALLLHDALLIITENNGAILIEMRLLRRVCETYTDKK